MMFRKLYWVTEQFGDNGASEVTGVYTSIPDLIRRGLCDKHLVSSQPVRLTLVKLDSDKEPLGCWRSPRFEGLQAGLQQFVLTDEFSEDQCKALVAELERFAKVTA